MVNIYRTTTISYDYQNYQEIISNYLHSTDIYEIFSCEILINPPNNENCKIVSFL